MEAIDYTRYKTFIFDCDGVLLNSNRIKTQAFYEAVIQYGTKNAQRLVDYHVSNGGISRYRKFTWFVNDVLGKNDSALIEELVQSYAEKVVSGLEDCEKAPVEIISKKFPNTNWMVASGGDQDELRKVFECRSLTSLFDLGIFGSPDDKSLIIEREVEKSGLQSNAVFFGDSKYDLEVAVKYGIDFVYVSAWSEWVPTVEDELKFTSKIKSLATLL